MKKKSKKAEKLLTEVELEMMTILWKRGEGTVNDVLDALPAGRNLAYTSVSTMLRILERKGAVTSHKEGRGHVYHPKLDKKDYETKSIQRLVDDVFGGAPAHLVQRLLDIKGLSEDELTAIQKLLDERRS